MMMYLKSFILLLLIGCSATHSNFTEAEMLKYTELKKWVVEKSLDINSAWAYPLATNALNQLANINLLGIGNTAGNVNLIGNPNYLKIDGERVSADLPYYGERQIGGGYNSTETGIFFEGIPKEYKVIENEKKKTQTISFSISQDTESYRVIITLHPTLKSNIQINSNQRTTISYSGEVKKLKREESQRLITLFGMVRLSNSLNRKAFLSIVVILLGSKKVTLLNLFSSKSPPLYSLH